MSSVNSFATAGSGAFDDDYDPTGQAKRRRVSQACDSCRKKKVRCDGKKPICHNCKNSKSACEYTNLPRKPRVVKRRKATTTINDLEHRLDKIEYLLEKSLKGRTKRKRSPESTDNESISVDDEEEEEDEEDEEVASDEANAFDGIVQEQEQSQQQQQQQQQRQQEVATPDLDLLEENIPMGGSNMLKVDTLTKLDSKSDIFEVSMARGIEQFCTQGTIFNLFTKNGLKWVSEKTGDCSLPDTLRNVFSNVHAVHQERLKPFIEHINHPMDFDLNLLQLCAKIFVRGPNVWLSVLSESELERMVGAARGNIPIRNGFAENLALSGVMGLCLPFMTYSEELKQQIGLTDEQIWTLYQKYCTLGMYNFQRVVLMGSNMVALKGLILLILAFQCGNSHPLSLFTPIAVRFAHEIGLHRDETCRGLPEDEVNRRRAMFWLLYCIDRDVAMKMGSSPNLQDYDISVSLHDPKYGMYTNGVDLLGKVTGLFRISGVVYEKLLSAQAAKNDPIELVKIVYELDNALIAWRDSLPASIRPTPDFVISAPREQFPSKQWYRQIGLSHIHLSYYQLVSIVHRLTAYNPTWINASIIKDMQSVDTNAVWNDDSRTCKKYKRVADSLNICVEAARASIEYVILIKTWGEQFVTGALFYSANSFITLFIKCIARPQDTKTPQDLELMEKVIRNFEVFEQLLASRCVPSHGAQKAPATEFWQTLYSAAANHVERSTRKLIKDESTSSGSTPSTAFSHTPPVIVGKGKVAPHHYSLHKQQQQAQQQPQQQPQQQQQQHQQHQQQQFMFQQQSYIPEFVVPEAPVQDPNNIDGTEVNPSTALGSNMSMAQSLFQVPSYFYNWEPDLMFYPEWNGDMQ